MLPVAGLDLGRTSDATALVVLDGLRVVDILVLEKTPFPLQFAALGGRLRRHSPLQRVAVDCVGIGLPAADHLAAEGFPVMRVNIGSGRASHHALFSGLRGAINSEHFSVAPGVPNRDLLRRQLKSLTARFTPSGKGLHVEAARGGHDDVAFALALAIHARRYVHDGTQADRPASRGA